MFPLARQAPPLMSYTHVEDYGFTHPSLEVDMGAPFETQSTSQKSALCTYFKAYYIIKEVESRIYFSAYLVLNVPTSSEGWVLYIE